jgi:hypothetical protein
MNGGTDLMREAARLHVVRLGNVTTPGGAAPDADVAAGALAPSSPAAASGLARRQPPMPSIERSRAP